MRTTYAEKILGLISGLSVSCQATAITLPTCPPACPTGAPYAEVTFFGAANYDIYDMTAPYLIDQDLTDAAGSGRGIANLSAGTLKALASATVTSNQFTTIATGRNLFTLGGLANGTVVSVSATLTGDGLINISQEGATGQVTLSLLGPSIPSSGTTRVYQGFSSPSGSNQVPLNVWTPLALATTNTFSVTVGTPFDLAYALRLDTRNGTQLDFMSTALLSFALPEGAILTSMGGYSPVPVPAAVWLFGSGLLGVIGLAQRRGRKT